MKKSGLAVVPVALFFLLVWALLVAVLHSGGETSKFASHIDEKMPVTDLPPLSVGKKGFASEDWKDGVYLVNFFASWCTPCHAEHAGLMRLAAAGVPIVGIAYKDSTEKAEAFLREKGDPYYVVADDAEGRAGIDWGITGVPETYLIDAHGVIRFHWNGPLTDEVIRAQLLPLWRKLSP